MSDDGPHVDSGLVSARDRVPAGRMIRAAVTPHFLRVRRLRKHGPVGSNLSLGRGSVILAETLRIGKNVEIGPGTVIRARHLEIGDDSSIGALSYFDVPSIRIGRHVKIREQVYVGGMTFPDSSLDIGNHVTIFQFTVINPTRPVVIEDGVGIGGRCSIFTHGSWQSAFKGFPVRFGPVKIERGAWLPWSVFVMPGVTIGANATLGAGSLVTSNIPPSALALGFPAKVVREPPSYPTLPGPEENANLLRRIVREFVQYCRFSRVAIEEKWEDEARAVIWTHTAADGRLEIWFSPLTAAGMGQNEGPSTVRVFLAGIPPNVPAAEAAGPAYICPDAEVRSGPLGPLAQEFVQFLERYGVRFLEPE